MTHRNDYTFVKDSAKKRLDTVSEVMGVLSTLTFGGGLITCELNKTLVHY